MVRTTRPMSWRTRGLAIGRAEVAAEVLRDDDVGGHLRPELRHLDVFLLEDDPAALVGDDGRAHLPFAGVVDVDARLGEEAVDGDAAGLGFLSGRLGGRAGVRGRREGLVTSIAVISSPASLYSRRKK